ncbi:hypothetical protein JHK87_052834 [Glycine soja]|nr:hypothetical protein JHK87_052834 [Glycine soja]
MHQDTFPKEEAYALGVYKEREPVFTDYLIRHIVAPNPNSLIFEHRPTERKPIIEKMDYDDEVAANPNAMVVSIYDPSPSRAYVKLIKAELPRTQEALTKALED